MSTSDINANLQSGSGADAYGRSARYLRLSITDRCNLRCFYCSPNARRQFIPHEKILRYEETLRLVNIFYRSGIRKTRITGGEPFARKNCVDFIAALRTKFPGMILCATSNGILLEPFARELSRLNLGSINISLDSLDRETFARITGADKLDVVLGNIDRLLSLGQRLKINVVALRGITDIQIDDFIRVAIDLPIDVRFIEFMPMGKQTRWQEDHFIPVADIFELVDKKVDISPVRNNADTFSGPAKMYEPKNGKGRFGFISALTNHFCGECNRLRLTAEGKLRTCLFADKEYDLAKVMRNPKTKDETLAKIIIGACRGKPIGSRILQARDKIAVAEKGMAGIGG